MNAIPSSSSLPAPTPPSRAADSLRPISAQPLPKHGPKLDTGCPHVHFEEVLSEFSAAIGVQLLDEGAREVSHDRPTLERLPFIGDLCSHLRMPSGSLAGVPGVKRAALLNLPNKLTKGRSLDASTDET